MAYTNLPATEVKDLVVKYKDAQAKVGKETGTEANRLKGLMALYVEEAKEQLDDDMQILTTSFSLHQKNIDTLVKAAQTDLKFAQQAAAKFKAKADPQYPPQVKYLATKLAKNVTTATQDALDFGDSWKAYRENVALGMPPQTYAAAEALRKRIITDSKITAAKIVQLKAAANEAEALFGIVDKATRKKVTGVGRPIGDAQQAARDLAAKMKSLLDEAQNPPGRGTQPNSIRSNSDFLKQAAANKNVTANPNNLSDNEGRWKNVEASFKGLTTRAASMEKVLAQSKKGFHSAELADKVVKAELAKAAKSLADVKADVKLYTPMAATAKTSWAKIQAAFKSKKK